MKFKFFILFFLSSVYALAQQDEYKITRSYSDAPLIDVINHVEAQSDYRFFFQQEMVDSIRISIDARQLTINEFLELAFKNTQVHFAIDSRKNIYISHIPIVRPSNPTIQTKETPSEKTAVIDDSSPLEKQEKFAENRLFRIGTPGSNISSRATLSGTIRAPGGEPLIGATIRVANSDVGAITDEKGKYSFQVPIGQHKLDISSIGYKPTTRSVHIFSSGTLDIEVEVQVTKLDEIVVQDAAESKVSNLKIGSEKLNIATIKFVPATFGETDVLKAVLTLPGVKTVGEASSGFNVRGGAADQNLILFNGSTVYNPFHFFGLFSSFNPEAIQSVELHKSVIPAEYGGRVSSVLDVMPRKGNPEKISGSAGIGLLTSRVNVEGPVIKDKLSFNFGGRTTYSNWIFGLLPKRSGYKNAKANFYDVNLLLDYKLNEKNSLVLSGYVSSDASNLGTDTLYSYRNRNFGLHWYHDKNSRVSTALSVSFDHYSYGNSSDQNPGLAYKLDFAIDQANLKYHANIAFNAKHELTFGVQSIFYQLNPGTYLPDHPESLVLANRIAKEQGLESSLFIQHNFDLSPKFSASAGFRFSMFNYLGSQLITYYAEGVPRSEKTITDEKSFGKNKIINTYGGPEARVSLKYAVNKGLSVKAGYNSARQYIHMLSNTIAISPTDIWKLSDPNIKPQLSQQISLGVYKNFSTTLEASVEGYVKRIDNFLDYKSGAVLVMNPDIEAEVFTTRGKAHGIEVMLKKPTGNFNGWLSYTYSRTLIKMDDPIAGEVINNGNYYPANYDKPHDFNFTGNQKISRRFSVSGNVNYSSGRPVTVPIGVYYYGGTQKTLYSDRNSYRIPDYFRVDVAVNLEGNHKVRQRTKNSWTFGVYNLTARKNPYSVFFTTENDAIKGYKLSIFGSMIPFVNYNIKF